MDRSIGSDPDRCRPRGGGRRFDPRVLIVGVLAGFLSGLFGVGGGILIVPALVLVTGMAQRLAHGTSLAAVLPIALSRSSATRRRQRRLAGGRVLAGGRRRRAR